MTLSKKLLGTIAAASVLLPAAASAHGFAFNLGGDSKLSSDQGLRFGQALEADGEHGIGLKLGLDSHGSVGSEDADRGHDSDEHHATTTQPAASAITRQAARIQSAVGVMTSFSSKISARIASSSLSASSTAAATAKLGAYNTDLASASSSAGTALSLASGISSTTDASTTASVLSDARDSLKAARDFLHQARLELVAVFRIIFGH